MLHFKWPQKYHKTILYSSFIYKNGIGQTSTYKITKEKGYVMKSMFLPFLIDLNSVHIYGFNFNIFIFHLFI